MSISSFTFISLALLLPLVPRQNNTLYKCFYLIVNLAFVYMASSNLIAFAILLSYVLLAYILKLIFKNKTIIYVFLILAFLYLRAYPLLTDLLNNLYPTIIEVFAISYVMFRTISYVADVEQASLIMYLDYVFSFYTITAGPVEEFADFEERFLTPYKKLSYEQILDYLLRIVLGYVKVLGIAYMFSSFSSKYDSNILVMSFFNFWYVYFNFSGYCDVVIGFARLAGFSIGENFKKPYLSQGIDEFWRKWNIGISSWLRNHIYFALGGSIHGEFRTIVNTFITFIVSGLWHCFNVNGLVFGILQSIGVLGFRYYNKYLLKKLGSKEEVKKYRNIIFVKYSEIIITFIFECLSFLFITKEII